MDHLKTQKGAYTISKSEIARLEWKWLAVKAIYGTS